MAMTLVREHVFLNQNQKEINWVNYLGDMMDPKSPFSAL